MQKSPRASLTCKWHLALLLLQARRYETKQVFVSDTDSLLQRARSAAFTAHASRVVRVKGRCVVLGAGVKNSTIGFNVKF